MESNSLIESYPMVGGDGPQSYAQNSSYQKDVNDLAKELIIESIEENLDLKKFNSNSFNIADLGCSVGPNTFTAVQNIIEAIEHQNPNPNPNKTLEFQVFFNDHTDNDFNTLFRSLPPSRQYYANGVPGSFHGRLFPNSSIHFIHSSYSLHWLSGVPKEVVDPNSAAWNKGSIHCTGFSKEVKGAYGKQYKNDIDSFLCARAKEVVNGGLMAITLCAIPNGVAMSQTGSGIFYDILGSCLMDMAQAGLISEEKVDSFNLPLYYAPIMELEEVIKQNGNFNIEKMSDLGEPPFKVNANAVVLQTRSAMEAPIEQHFGCEILDQLFDRFTIKFSQNFNNFFPPGVKKSINLFVLLKRKFD